jgi:DNA-binding NarL/FixJ family response regulator
MLQPHISRVLVADDHPIVRRGLTALFHPYAEFEIVGEAADGQEALDLCATLHPDIVLMDIHMPVMDGVDATRRIVLEYPEISVIIFSGTGELERVPEAMTEGARGFIRKNASLVEIVVATRMMAFSAS